MTSHVQTETVFASCIIDLKDNIEGDVEDFHTEYNTNKNVSTNGKGALCII